MRSAPCVLSDTQGAEVVDVCSRRREPAETPEDRAQSSWSSQSHGFFRGAQCSELHTYLQVGVLFTPCRRSCDCTPVRLKLGLHGLGFIINHEGARSPREIRYGASRITAA